MTKTSSTSATSAAVASATKEDEASHLTNGIFTFSSVASKAALSPFFPYVYSHSFLVSKGGRIGDAVEEDGETSATEISTLDGRDNEAGVVEE